VLRTQPESKLGNGNAPGGSWDRPCIRHARGAKTGMAIENAVVSESKAQPKRKERVRRRRGERTEANSARYFLVKSSGADQMELGDEAATENDAMVTAFRSGGTFAIVTEWKTNVDLTDGHPVIKKEPVRRERS
jgi:hypothetical protein